MPPARWLFPLPALFRAQPQACCIWSTVKNQAHAKLLYRFESYTLSIPFLSFANPSLVLPSPALLSVWLQNICGSIKKRHRIELYKKCKGNICSTFRHRSNNPGYARKCSSVCARVCVFAPNWPEESCGIPLALFKRRWLVLQGHPKYI